MISIITTTKNSAQTIEATLRSVAEQSYQQFEYIVVDGASNDHTMNIIDRYRPIISHVISEPDTGLYDALNKGIKIASGDYIGILNSDDVYASKNTLEQVVEILTAKSVDALYGDVTYFEGADPHRVSRYYSSSHFHPSRLKWGLMPAHTSLFLKSDIFRQYGYYKTDYKIAADFEFMCRIFKDQSLHSAYMEEVLIRMKSGGASTKNLAHKFIIQNELLRACHENDISTHHAKLLMRYFFKFFDYFR